MPTRCIKARAPPMTPTIEQVDHMVQEQKKASDTAVVVANRVQDIAWWLTIAVGPASVALGTAVAVFMINGLNSQMSTIVAELADGSDQIASAAGQVSSSSQSLAQGSSEQAASLQDTSAPHPKRSTPWPAKQ